MGGEIPMKTRWVPRYSITDKIAADLMTIEKIRIQLENAQIPLSSLARIRESARIRSAHFSTQIEGNRLTLQEAREVVKNQRIIQERARDSREVKNYWDALLKIEEWAQGLRSFDEYLIKKTHSIVEKGLRAKPSAYRTEQNVIRDSLTNAIIYLPPEAKDVPELMGGLVNWEHDARNKTPVPLIAALVHYQFVTIHPFYDGNGRTARLLSTFILQRGGYGLNGIFSLEEYHARNLQLYYNSLMTHPHHNYYEGRENADLTGWIGYFVELLAKVFEAAGKQVLTQGVIPSDRVLFRRLDHRQKNVLSMFASKDSLTVRELANNLGLSDRMVRNIVNKWVQDGFLEVLDPSNKNRRYGLSEIYRQFIGNES